MKYLILLRTGTIWVEKIKQFDQKLDE